MNNYIKQEKQAKDNQLENISKIREAGKEAIDEITRALDILDGHSHKYKISVFIPASTIRVFTKALLVGGLDEYKSYASKLDVEYVYTLTQEDFNIAAQSIELPYIYTRDTEKLLNDATNKIIKNMHKFKLEISQAIKCLNNSFEYMQPYSATIPKNEFQRLMLLPSLVTNSTQDTLGSNIHCSSRSSGRNQLDSKSLSLDQDTLLNLITTSNKQLEQDLHWLNTKIFKISNNNDELVYVDDLDKKGNPLGYSYIIKPYLYSSQYNGLECTNLKPIRRGRKIPVKDSNTISIYKVKLPTLARQQVHSIDMYRQLLSILNVTDLNQLGRIDLPKNALDFTELSSQDLKPATGDITRKQLSELTMQLLGLGIATSKRFIIPNINLLYELGCTKQDLVTIKLLSEMYYIVLEDAIDIEEDVFKINPNDLPELLERIHEIKDKLIGSLLSDRQSALKTLKGDRLNYTDSQVKEILDQSTRLVKSIRIAKDSKGWKYEIFWKTSIISSISKIN